ncbi:MAG TPA: hypothetical protein HA367_00870 [Candidatus Methanofastidiosum sp.]|nr:hypothetical protein [Methanofastidiosum sp.]
MHLGDCKSILISGYIDSGCFYPSMAMQTAMDSLITNLDIYTWSILIPVVFTSIYFIGVYLIGCHISKSNNEKIMILLFGFTLLLGEEHTCFRCTSITFLLIPLLVYVFLRCLEERRAKGYTWLFILVIGALTFYHPADALLCILLLSCIVLGDFCIYAFNSFATPTMVQRTESTKQVFSDLKLLRTSTKLRFISIILHGYATERRRYLNILFRSIAIILVVLLSWLLSFSMIHDDIKMVFKTLVEIDTSASQVNYAFNLVEMYGVSYYDVALEAIKIYGGQISFILLGIIFTLTVVFNFKGIRSHLNDYSYCFIIVFIVFLVLTIIFMGLNLIIGWQRVIRYGLLASLIVNGTCLHAAIQVAKENKRKTCIKILSLAVIAMLTLTYFCGFVTAIPTPLTKKTNVQVTDMELHAVGWLNKCSNKFVPITSLNFEPYRLSFALVGRSHVNEIGNLRGWWHPDFRPPEHFNYNSVSFFGESISYDYYLSISTLARQIYQRVYPEYSHTWPYSPSDFAHLEVDNSVKKIYSNGELDTYYISHSENRIA